MRSAWVVLLLAPLVVAQAPDVELLSTSIDPFERPIEPLQGSLSTTVRTRASCLLSDAGSGVVFTYAVVEQPTWATALISPATDARIAETCETGWHEMKAALTVTVSDQAPAFTPTPVVVEVTAGSGQREQRARAGVNVTASYFAILDVQVAEPQVVLAPGASHDFVVRVMNYGNGDTRVESVVEPPPDGLVVAGPALVTLESKQTGGTRIADDLVFRVTAPSSEAFVNRVSLVNVAMESWYAADDRMVGDSSSVSFLVTVRTGGDGELARRAVPALEGSALAGLVVAAVALTSRRRA